VFSIINWHSAKDEEVTEEEMYGNTATWVASEMTLISVYYNITLDGTGMEEPVWREQPPSIMSPVVDNKWTRPGHWLGLVFYVLFSAFILIVMWQEGRPACKKTHSTNSLLVAWHSSRTSVFGLRIFHVLCETCSWWVTTYVGKPSATVQQTRPTQPFISLGSIDE